MVLPCIPGAGGESHPGTAVVQGQHFIDENLYPEYRALRIADIYIQIQYIQVLSGSRKNNIKLLTYHDN